MGHLQYNLRQDGKIILVCMISFNLNLKDSWVWVQ
jgi:hypothetical protein